MRIKLICSLLAAAATLSAVAQSQGYKDGIEFYKAGQYDNAKTILERTLNDAQTDKALSYYYLGQVALAKGDKAAAKTNFTNGVSANAECPYNYVGLGAIDLLDGNAKAAEDQFKDAQKLAKKDAEVSVNIARAYYNADPVKYAKEMDKAMSKARKDSKNQEPAIYILEGDMLADAKEYGNAAAKYEMAITFDKNNPEGYVKYANSYFNVNPNFAISKLEEFYKLAPTSALAQRELAEKYYQGNHWNKAADLYGDYIKNPNHFPEDKARYSVLLYWGKKYEDSKRVAQEILAQDPSTFLMQRMMFLNDAALENNEAAAAEAKSFFEKNPNGYFTTNDYTTYADVLSKLGNDSLAAVQYETAVSKDPDNADLISELSSFYTKAKNYPKAADTYALYLSKLEDPSTNDLFGAARRYLNAAATAAPEDSVARHDAAEKGLKYINDAIAGAVPNPVLYQFKARLNIADNNNHPNQEAIDAYNEMIALLDQDPANKDPKNADNKLNLYKEAYQFTYLYNGNVLKDKEKTAEVADKLKAINDLINGTAPAEAN